MRRFVLGFMVALFVVLEVSAIGYAAGKSNLILIFDASGSMWGQIDGKAKITIAKEAMDLIVNDLPEDINIGLVAYGHRRKGDCDDVETLIPLGPLSPKAFIETINTLNPKGKTPMVRSIRKTAESIKHLEDETTILLVSDGEETCDPEPCNFVGELEKLGIKFVLHVVGFDVGGQTEEQLKCMAKAGGGEYFPAGDAGKLKHALDTVVKKAVAKNLVVTSFDAANNPVSVMINVLDQTGNIVATDGGKRVSFSLAPGTYRLKVNPDTLTTNITVENVIVTENKVTEKKVVFAKSQIIVTMKDGNGNNIPGYIRIVDRKSGQYAEEGDHTGNLSGFIVSPGDYLVDMECSNTGRRIKSPPFTLQPGENKTINGICANARIGVLVTDAGGNSITGYIRIVNISTDSYADEADSQTTMRFFEVPPGDYKVDVECPGESRLRSNPFYIQQGQENQVTINCETKKIDTTLPTGDSETKLTPKPGKPNAAVGVSAPPVNQARQKSVPQSAVSMAPKDVQAMAAQAQSDAMEQMQKAMQSLQTPQASQSPSGQTTPDDQHMDDSPRDTTLPQVADGPAGYTKQLPTADDAGAKAIEHVGAPPPTVDYSNVGAQDTGGGLDDIDERPEQGQNPYDGMTTAEMQAAFARDMGMQNTKDTGHKPEEFSVGTPLDTKRHINTLGYRLDTYREKASALNRNDIMNRIDTAQINLDVLDKQLKARVDKNVLQKHLDQCVQESHAIKISLLQAQ